MADPVSRVSRVLMREPLAPFAEEYRSELLGRGYTPLTAVNQLRQVSRLSCWLVDHGLRAADVSEERIGAFLAFQRAGGRHRAQWSRPGLLCLLEVLRRADEAPAAEPPGRSTAEDLLLASFERYLLTERGLAASPTPIPVMPPGPCCCSAGPPRSRRRPAKCGTSTGAPPFSHDIARRLGITRRTAEAHAEHIMTKLGVHSRAQVAAWVERTRPRG
jgi:hypothetical protein